MQLISDCFLKINGKRLTSAILKSLLGKGDFMKKLKIILLSAFILTLFSCGGSGKLPFKGSGFGGPQNDNEARIAKAINKTPIVFVHGYLTNASYWDNARSYFLKNGYSPYELFAINFKDNELKFISTEASELKTFVKNVLKYTGKSKVILIAHSRGGIVARTYLKMFKGYSSIEKCVLIATANQGTPVTPSYDYIHPSNSFIKNLNKPDENVLKVKYLCIAAAEDRFFPTGYKKSTFLDYAKNITISGTNHLSVAKDERTFKEILSFIEN
jgi:triacylglycerol lipase